MLQANPPPNMDHSLVAGSSGKLCYLHPVCYLLRLILASPYHATRSLLLKNALSVSSNISF
jgi:hypothetical protein